MVIGIRVIRGEGGKKKEGLDAEVAKTIHVHPVSNDIHPSDL